MPDVQSDVTGPLNAVANVMQGMAAKNQTMKDGPPSGGGGGGGGEGTKTRPTAEEKKSAYEQYKKDIQDVWSKYNQGKLDGGDLALGIGKAVTDLAVTAGPEVLKLLGDLAKGQK